MTRKDYQLIADALKASTPLARDGADAMRCWGYTVLAMAAALERTNPAFDRSRFIAACRGE